MATLYYNDTLADGDWANLQSWWTDPDCNIQATSLPTATDNVVLSGSVIGNSSGSAITVANLEMNDPSENALYLELNITVTGTATFNSIVANNGPITGNVVFNDSANNNGPITGNVVFNDSADNNGPITGNATFNDSASNGSLISGTATFNGSAQMQNGTITGNATFNGSASMRGGTVEGSATLNDTSALDGYNYPAITGTVVLNDYATANGSWYAADPTTFNDHANLTNQYVTTEPCEFNDHATCNGFGMRGGATFNDFCVCAATADFGAQIFTFNDSATGGFDVQNGGWSPPEPDVTYNDRSYGSGKAKSLTINGAAVMQSAYLNGYNPVLDYSFTRPQYGINGSSILGVI